MGATRDRTRLTPADQVMYRGDKESRARTGMCMVEVYDGVPAWDYFVESWERASRVVPRLRHRVVEPTLPTTMSRWAVDPEFDLRYHVRRRSLAGDGSHRELLDVAEEIAMTPLDPCRPLWTMTLVSGLRSGGAATIFSGSHSLGDVGSMVAMFEQLYDTEPVITERPMPPLPDPDDLGPGDLALEGLKEMPGLAFGLARTMTGMTLRRMRSPFATTRAAASYVLSLQRTAGSIAAAKPSPLLAKRGASRRTVTLDLDLDHIRAAAVALNGTVNDVYIAAVCGVMRRYHEAKGSPVERMPFGIPVSVRRTEEDGSEGNRWTGLGLSAPVGEADPAARIEEIGAMVRAGRKGVTRGVMDAATTVMAVMPSLLLAPALESVPAMDVQASNARFYPGETYFGGCQIVAQYALGPVPGVAVMFAMVTRRGKAFVSARYDTASVDDGDLFETCLEEGFAEVLTAAAPALPATKRATRAKRARKAPG